MTDDDITSALSQGHRAAPSPEMERRMRALFETHSTRGSWIRPLMKPVPCWVIPLACAVSAACGFLINSLLTNANANARPRTLAICTLNGDRPLARRFIRYEDGQATKRLGDFAVHVGTSPQNP